MKKYSISDAPIKVLGIPFFDKTHKIVRVPDDVIEKVPTLAFHGRRVPGGRVCFRTNSESIRVVVTFKTAVFRVTDFSSAWFNVNVNNVC